MLGIRIEYMADGRKLIHPSGVEVFEPKEKLESRLAELDRQIASLEAEKNRLQEEALTRIELAKAEADKET